MIILRSWFFDWSENQNRRRGPAAYTPTGKRIFFPESKKRRLPTDRRTLILTTSAICRKRKIYVIFCRMEKPCNPQLNYRAAIRIYPVFPGPNFRLSLHPLWSPSTKENLWTFYRQPPSVWGEHTWKYSILFPKVSIFFQSTLKLCCICKRSADWYCRASSHLEFITDAIDTFYIIGYIGGNL